MLLEEAVRLIGRESRINTRKVRDRGTPAELPEYFVGVPLQHGRDGPIHRHQRAERNPGGGEDAAGRAVVGSTPCSLSQLRWAWIMVPLTRTAPGRCSRLLATLLEIPRARSFVRLYPSIPETAI